MRPYRFSLGILALICLSPLAWGQNDPKFFDRPKTPDQFWRAAQFELSVGNLELSAGYLKGFLAANPSDQDIIAIIEAGNRDPRPDRKGLIPFIQLRNVPRWNEEAAANTESKETVEKVIARVTLALKNHYGDAKRIQRFIANLVATPEEAEFAGNELLKSGREAVPLLLQTLANKPTDEMRVAILDLLRSFDVDSVPAILAFLEFPDPLTRTQLITVLRQRRDFQSLMARVDTDPRPVLWYFAGLPVGQNDVLKAKARELLSILYGTDSERRSAVDELVKIARSLAEGRGTYANPKAVAIWTLDPKQGLVIPPPTNPAINQSRAEEILGLKYLRWALELNPKDLPARELFVHLAADKTYLRHSLDTPLSQGNPELYELLTKTPLPIILAVQERALAAQNPRVSLALTQFLADRADNSLPAFDLLVKALYFKDDRRVNFAAALGISRIANPPPHRHHTQVLEILRGHLSNPPPKVDAVKPTAIMVDLDPLRIRTMSVLMNRIGYRLEVVPTGTELLRRLRHKADVSIALVDRHTFAPPLLDLLASLRTDPRCSSTPVYVIATTDQAVELDLSSLLLRLVLIITTTDELPPQLIKPKLYEDPRDGVLKNPVEENDRVAQITSIIDARFNRVIRMLEAQEIPIDRMMQDRIRMFTLLAAATEITLPPGLVTQLTRLSDYFLTAGAQKQDEKTFRDRMVLLVTRLEKELQPPAMEKLDRYRLAVGGTRAVGGLPSARSEELERQLAKTAAPYRHVFVIPESFSEQALITNLAVNPQATQLLGEANILQVDQIVAVVQARGKVAETVRNQDAILALEALRLLSTGNLPGYDMRPIESALRGELQSSDPTQIDRAIEIVGTIPSKLAQQDLANVILRTDLPIALRIKAAETTLRHMQWIGKNLSTAQVTALQSNIPGTNDKLLRGLLLQMTGQLAPSVKTTEDQFQAYQPMVVAPPEVAPKPAAPVEPKEEPPADK